LALPLQPNVLPVVDGAAQITLSLPATPADGLLGPGAFPLRDGVAPVLRSAVLRRHDPALAGAPDTLVVVVSETLDLPSVGGRAFAAWDITAGASYVFEVAGGSAIELGNLKTGEAAYAFPVLGTPASGGPPAVPDGGDSVWIAVSAGIGDAAGQIQLNPGNRRVILRIAVPLRLTVGPAAPGGLSSILHPGFGDPTWSVIAEGTDPLGGSGGAGLPVRTGAVNPVQFGGLSVTATAPFNIELRVFSNLGQKVGQVALQLDDASFARLPASGAGSRKLDLLWNGRSGDGQLAASGAYIYVWKLTGFDTEGRRVSQDGRKIYGILRTQ
jgi:hypothetical protein